MRKTNLEQGEDSDGKMVYTTKQKLGRDAAEAALTDILFSISPERLSKLSRGCCKVMRDVLLKARE